MLQTLIVVLVVLWLLGYRLNFGGNFIHVLLVIALVVLVIKILT
jgi:hypothetical protein